MKFNSDILEKLNGIHQDREDAYDLLFLLENYRPDRKILLIDSYVQEDEEFDLSSIKSTASKIPPILMGKIIETVKEYIEGQDKKFEQIEIRNLPFEHGVIG